MEKKILLLGAGASVPFYDPRLSTGYLNSLIQNRQKWDNLVQRYTAIMTPNINMVSVNEVFNVLNNILRINNNLNFEEIIEIYDKISSYNFHPYPQSKIFHDILIYYNALAPILANHTWDCIPFLFRQLIAEELGNLHNNHKVSNYSELSNLQSEFISNVSKDSAINIFSLSYDEILYDSLTGLNFENGFSQSSRFDINRFLSSTKTVSFPHGQIRFILDGVGISDKSGVLYIPNFNIANANRLQNINALGMNDTKYLTDSRYSYSFNTFLSTGQQKEPTFDLNPYSTYFQKFASDCLFASKIYIVGYSFGDDHFNRMIANFLKLSSNNKIYIIDKINGNINILNEYMSQTGLIYKVLSFFTNSIPLNNNQQYLFQTQQLQLNQTGFAEIFPQIFFYKDGYDSFLKCFNTLPL